MPFGARKNLGLILGIIIFIVGFIALLNKIGILPFGIPLSVNILAWILAAGGLYLIIESITEIGIRRTIALFAAFIILLLTLTTILNQFGVISFLIPGISLALYHILLVVEGIFLIINAFGT